MQTCGGGSITLNAKEKRVLVLHNQARKDLGLRPLCVDLKLTRAARSHSREMIEKDYFSHSSYDGESVSERLRRFGYDLSIYGENIAGGSGTFGEPDSTFRRWMNSPGHKANILDSRFRPVGVGTYTGDYKGIQEYTMYTVDFGVGARPARRWCHASRCFGTRRRTNGPCRKRERPRAGGAS